MLAEEWIRTALKINKKPDNLFIIVRHTILRLPNREKTKLQRVTVGNVSKEDSDADSPLMLYFQLPGFCKPNMFPVKYYPNQNFWSVYQYNPVPCIWIVCKEFSPLKHFHFQR